MRLSFSSLRVRLLALVLLAVLPPVALVVYADIEQRHNDLRRTKDELQRLVRVLPLIEGRGEFEASRLPQIAAQARLPSDALLMVLDARGQILATYPNAGTAKDLPFAGPAEIGGQLQSQDPLVLELPGLDQVLRVFAFTQVGSQTQPTYLGLGIPKESALVDANRTLARNLVVLGLMGLLLFEAAWLGGDFFVIRQVQPLVAATRRLTAGDLTARTGAVYAPGELGELARSFDEMAESLAQAEAQKQIDEELRRRNFELEQQNLSIQGADRLKSEFVSMVSHELRTPLTSINGYVDLLLDGDVGSVTEDQRECLVAIRDNGRRLLALITDLLELSRIEAGRVDLSPTIIDVGRVVESVAASFRPQVRAKVQQLGTDLPDGLPVVYADADRVAQILTNLVSNAHKYTPSGGTITIRARPEESHVRISVEDNGVGLSARELPQVFTKFYRAENEATRGATGTGLGLAITRSLVEAHHGQITATSVPGQGSTFTFTLPLSPPP